MSIPVGTLEWMKKSQGYLSPKESREMMMKILHMQLTLIPDEWLHKLNLKRPQDLSVDFESLEPPDTANTQHVRELCRKHSGEFLFNHCERSYYWGRILGEQTGVNPDPELYYIACMLHDMGLTETFGQAEERPACFSQIGADWCKKVGDELGWSDEWVRLSSEAITLHLNPGVDLIHGPEAYLLNQATTLDTTAVRLWRVPKPMAKIILSTYPLLDQSTALPVCFCNDVKRFKNTRTAWLEKNVKMGKRISKAKFNV